MLNYTLYSLAEMEKGKISHRLAELTGHQWKLEEARRRSELSKDRTRPYWGNGRFAPSFQCAKFEILRLPDIKDERKGLLNLSNYGMLLSQPTRFSYKAYAVFAPTEDEAEVSYIAGWYNTQSEAKECQTKGRVVLVMYKGSKLSLRGDCPEAPIDDLWGLYD